MVRIAESLEVLRRQLNAAFPQRSTASDGGIGDAAHASFMIGLAVSFVSASFAFTSNVKTTVFNFVSRYQIFPAIWMTLRTKLAVFCGIVIPFFRHFKSPTFSTGKSPFAASPKSINNFPHNRVFVTVRTEIGAIRFWWLNSLCWKNRQIYLIGRHIKNNLFVTSAAIFRNCNRFQVVGADAVANSAKMVNLKRIRYFSNLVLVCKSMCCCLSPATFRRFNGKSAVTIFTGATDPEPTPGRILFNANPKTSCVGMFVNHRGIITHSRSFAQ